MKIINLCLFALAYPALLLGCSESKPAAGSQGVGAGTVQQPELFGAVQVRLGTASSSKLESNLSLRGLAEPYRKATVAAEAGGRVLSRRVEPGDVVQQSQLLFSLDDTDAKSRIAEARANVASRQVALDSAKSSYRRGTELMEKAFISEGNLEDMEFAVKAADSQLKAAKAALDSANNMLADASLTAPFSGVAEQVHVQEGDLLAPGTPVIVLADFSRLRVRAGVTASQAAQLQQGTEVLVSFESVGLGPVAGEVRSVGRIAEAGSYPLEIWLDGKGLQAVREGMVANIDIAIVATASTLSVPVAAVLRNAGKAQVFLVEGQKAKLHDITVGASIGDRVEVLSGLSEGQHVVVDGQFSLRDGASISPL